MWAFIYAQPWCIMRGKDEEKGRKEKQSLYYACFRGHLLISAGMIRLLFFLSREASLKITPKLFRLIAFNLRRNVYPGGRGLFQNDPTHIHEGSCTLSLNIYIIYCDLHTHQIPTHPNSTLHHHHHTSWGKIFWQDGELQRRAELMLKDFWRLVMIQQFLFLFFNLWSLFMCFSQFLALHCVPEASCLIWFLATSKNHDVQALWPSQLQCTHQMFWLIDFIWFEEENTEMTLI